MLFRALKNPLTTMAESVGENLSESSDDSSAPDSGMVFEGIWECMNVFVVSIPNE